jgi:hypothetical protein
MSSDLGIETPLNESSLINVLNSLITIGKVETSIQLKNILTVETEWEQKYFIRQAFLSIKNILTAYENYSNKISAFIISQPGLIKLWDEINIDLQAFKAKHNSENDVEKVITATVISIDGDFKNYFDTLIGININESISLIIDFLSILEKMLLFSCECIETTMGKLLTLDEAKEKFSEVYLRIDAIRNAFNNLN